MPQAEIYFYAEEKGKHRKPDLVQAESSLDFTAALKKIKASMPNMVNVLPSQNMQNLIQIAIIQNKIPVFLFTKGSKSTPHAYKSLALLFKDKKVVFGQIGNPTEALKAQLQIKKLPFLGLMFPSTKSQDSDGKDLKEAQQALAMASYNPKIFGGFKLNQMAAWLEVMMQNLGNNGQTFEDLKSTDTEDSSQEESSATSKGVNFGSKYDFVELTSENFKDICSRRCAIAFIDDMSPDFEDYKKVVESVYQRKKNVMPVVWMKRQCQDDFIKVFDVRGDELPSMVIYNFNRGKTHFKKFMGAFTELKLSAFVQSFSRAAGYSETQESVIGPKPSSECSPNDAIFEDATESADDDDMIEELLAEQKEAEMQREIEERKAEEAEKIKKERERERAECKSKCDGEVKCEKKCER